MSCQTRDPAMPFLLLLLLTLACLPDPQDRTHPPDWLGDRGSMVVTWASMIAVAAIAWGASWRLRKRLTIDPSCREEVLRRYASARFCNVIFLFIAFGLDLFVFGWGYVASEPLAKEMPAWLPVIEVLILAPFLAGLILSWTIFYEVERALHASNGPEEDARPFWSRRTYVWFHIRQNAAIVFVPVLLLIMVKNVPRLLPEGSERWQEIAAVLAPVGVLAVMPWILRITLGLRPLPDGELKDRLEAASRRLSFRCNGIMLWNTRSGVANALMVGVLPFLRYVVLSDRLIAEMTPDEVEAVFGHEVGHVKHRHMIYFMGFLMVSVAAVLAVLDVVVPSIWTSTGPDSWCRVTADRDQAMLPMVVLLGTYIFVVFGFVSRRCERQADIYGCRTVSCGQPDCSGHDGAVLQPGARGLCGTGIRTFISALEKVARLNGISRDKPGWFQSWQHSTIARRVDFLQSVLVEPAVEQRFQRRVMILKWALFVGLGALFLLFTFVLHRQMADESRELQGAQAVSLRSLGARS